jgi:hypothetical protein
VCFATLWQFKTIYVSHYIVQNTLCVLCKNLCKLSTLLSSFLNVLYFSELAVFIVRIYSCIVSFTFLETILTDDLCYKIFLFLLSLLLRSCDNSGGESLASHRGGPDSSQGQVMWDLWWMKWHLGRFSPTVYLADHSTDCSTLTIIYHSGLVQ